VILIGPLMPCNDGGASPLTRTHCLETYEHAVDTLGSRLVVVHNLVIAGAEVMTDLARRSVHL